MAEPLSEPFGGGRGRHRRFPAGPRLRPVEDPAVAAGPVLARDAITAPSRAASQLVQNPGIGEQEGRPRLVRETCLAPLTRLTSEMVTGLDRVRHTHPTEDPRALPCLAAPLSGAFAASGLPIRSRELPVLVVRAIQASESCWDARRVASRSGAHESDAASATRLLLASARWLTNCGSASGDARLPVCVRPPAPAAVLVKALRQRETAKASLGFGTAAAWL
jgi:hypothetical protein